MRPELAVFVQEVVLEPSFAGVDGVEVVLGVECDL